MARETDPADQRLFTMSTEEYDRLLAELERPARVLPRLAALLARPSAFRGSDSDE